MKNFVIGAVSTIGINSTVTAQIPDLTNLAQSTPELIGSVVAGIVSTVVINILKSRYPRLFKKQSIIKRKTNGTSSI